MWKYILATIALKWPYVELGCRDGWIGCHWAAVEVIGGGALQGKYAESLPHLVLVERKIFGWWLPDR